MTVAAPHGRPLPRAGTLVVLQHRRDELVNRDPDRCPREACERCPRRCTCPPCRCARCLELPAELRRRHDDRRAERRVDAALELEAERDLNDLDDLTLFDL